MFLEERVEQYAQDIKNKYHCEDIDFSDVNKNRKKIMHKGGSKKIVKDLNERIDLDFIKESDLIEGVEDVDVTAFLEDENTEIVHSSKKKKALNNLDPVTMARESVRGCVVLATNPKLGILSFTNQHLAALKFVLKEARFSQLQHKSIGFFKPLSHDLITTANEMVLPGKFDVPSYYRNEYSYGSCHVVGANWTPVSSPKVPARMEALLKWYNEETEMAPIVKAAILHCEFIKIHPFSDGNGRTARLLVNYELAKHRFPTIVIKARNKRAYFDALEKGITTGDVTDVANMIKEKVLESQHKQLLALDALAAKKNNEKES